MSDYLHCRYIKVYLETDEQNNYVSECTTVCLQKMFLVVFKTAVRSSRRRQQYKNGLIEEFINARVSTKPQVFVQLLGEMDKISIEINNGA